MKDIILTCKGCGSQFYFTAGEQRYYKQNGLNFPKYCKSCREHRKSRASSPVRACSTCYFCSRFEDSEYYYQNRYAFEDAFGNYISDNDLICEYNNGKIVNDKPCACWHRR